MGWNSGSYIGEAVWNIVRPYLTEPERAKCAKAIIEVFEDYDCDVMDEAEVLWEDAGYGE